MKPRNDEAPAYYDARFQHPFNCIVAGPSGCGKSSFVRELLEHELTHISVVFDWILIYLGTKPENNPVLNSLRIVDPSRVEIVDFRERYPKTEDLKESFPHDLEHVMTDRSGEGLVIFDDLMLEMSKSRVLVDLFTKHSHHLSVSSINITQNLFFQGTNKSDSVSVYRNAHNLVLFASPMDQTVNRYVCSKQSFGEEKITTKEMARLMKEVQKKFGYIIISAGQNTPEELRFRSDIFNTTPDGIFSQAVFVQK